MERIIEILKQDPIRLDVLNITFELNLPQCYVAAGFVRNMIWDHLHGYDPSKLNDIDVIYYDLYDTSVNTISEIETELLIKSPEHNWQVRNQAVMHKRNNDLQYASSIDAMSYWPEKETAVGIRKVSENQFEVISAFDIELLFSNSITYNPKRDIGVFKNRVDSKNWLTKWPKLNIYY
ncbi:MAG: nucleotidyltransferase family protein [Spirochaetales bacterium]|nr:nucleotidyltransferase family protein [Spirochaetales bacterium]